MTGKHSNYTAEGKIALNALINIYKEKMTGGTLEVRSVKV